ncbi:MAG: DUF2779 domain-containing protein [Nanoarchaeota archaeon]
MNKPTFLTKSRYVNGLQCSKWLWLSFNRPEDLPKVDDATQHKFDEGHKVGELSKTLFPDGIEVKEQLAHHKNDEETKELLKKRKPLFEAGAIHKDEKCYARADILVPVDKDKWDIYEVKSSTEVKEEYIWDVAFQKYCYESAGIKIRNCFVMHINNQYVRQGKIDPKEFFITAPISDEVEEEIKNVESNIKKLFRIIELKECPEIKPQESCCLGSTNSDRFEEIHQNDKFWKEHPECDIFDMYRGGKRALELFNEGILEIGKLESVKLNDKQQIQHETHKSKKPHCNIKELESFIKSLKYPLYFMDFESYNTAIPLYNGLKPYQQIPFQFSIHIIPKKGAKTKHISFIASGSDDPRPEFIKQLKKALGTKGSVIVYNQTFEQTVLKKIAEYLPLHQKWVDSVVERMVDLLIPFRNFAYYHPDQHGSASIKKVLPVLTGQTYENFEIANGSDASLSYLHITHEPASKEEIQKVREDLEKYCGQDTEGMIWILDKLKELIK